MFKKKLKENSLNDKIKSLILLSLIHSKMNKNKISEIESVFLINKDYLDSFYFSEINKLITENKKIQNNTESVILINSDSVKFLQSKLEKYQKTL